jgi:Fe-S-cluster-containing dehydrogenase component
MLNRDDGGEQTSGPEQPIDYDEQWETRAEEVLDETDADTELGLELARDAQRVVAGEMSESAFEQKYHEEIVEEFGEDSRELDVPESDETGDGESTDAESIVDSLEQRFDDEESRREFMKKSGLAAMGVSLLLGQDTSGQVEPSASPESDDEGTRWGMVINLNNCDGCLECVQACKGLHGTSRGAHWIYVMAYEDDAQDDEGFFVRTCQHCSNAPCEKVCPVGARHTREKDGLVLTDYEACIGCRYCMVSCPYGANYFQWGEPDSPIDDETFTHDERGMWVDGPPPEGVMSKCTFEPSWQDGAMGEEMVGTTMCEQACTRDAIHFGDMNDPESDPNQHLQEYREEHSNDQSEFPNRKDHTVSTFRALEERGTDPAITFIGNEPSEDAEQVEGPVTYEEMGLLDNRKEHLDDGADAGGEQS